MNRNQKLRNRAIRKSDTPAQPVSRNLLARTQTYAAAPGVVRRTRCAPMTDAQRDSTGARSDWNAPTDFFTDPKWSQTVSNPNR